MYQTPPNMDDIHAIQIQDYQHTKNMSVQDQKKYYRNQAAKLLHNAGYDLVWDKKSGVGKLVEK